MGILDAPAQRPQRRSDIPLTIGTNTNAQAGPLQTAQTTSRCPMRVAVAGGDLVLSFNGWRADAATLNDLDWPADQPIAASIEDPSGTTIRRVTFTGGGRVGIIPAGGTLNSDPIGLDVAAGVDLYVRVCPQNIVHLGCGTTSGSATITDPSITASDYGRTVTGAGIPGGAYVGTVTPGVSYTLSNASRSQAGSLTASATASGLALTLGPLWYANRLAPGASPGYGGSAAGDLTAPGSGAIADTTSGQGAYQLAPFVVRGTPAASTHATVIGAGDSIVAGTGDGVDKMGGLNTAYPRLQRGGFVVRALAGTAGLVNISVAGDTVQNFITNDSHYRRLALGARALNAVSDFATNDIYGGRTLAQLQGDLITMWGMFAARRGKRFFHTTCLPRTTSTDGWVTEAGQSPANAGYEAVRIALNAWYRDGCPMQGGAPVAVGTTGPLVSRCAVSSKTGALVSPASGPAHPVFGIWDTAAAVESVTTPGVWAAPTINRTVTDAAATAAAFSFSSASAAFVAANDLGRLVTIAGAGSGGAVYVGRIYVHTSGTVQGVSPAIGTTVSGATAKIFEGVTPDGVHPCGEATANMAGACNVAQLNAAS